ncbi:MAG: glycoside hydrolase family 32 protein [Armatimonadota bacterium]|nr:GH32 C-terminal domain-containing protein [bacterium]
MPFFYKPDDGYTADFIPFYWNDSYHLFYLKDYRDVDKHGEGTPWFQIVTRDFVNFEDWGEAIPRGAQGTQDLWIFTGSAIEANSEFSIFYTAHNHHMMEQGKPCQAVTLATSPDLRTWTKHPEVMMYAPGDKGYEPHDWRDPFVFWNEEAGEYWMLLAARLSAIKPSRNRGCTALMASPDLKTWELRDPFWAPNEYFTHECPDLFKMGDWWYLVYSTFTERCVTHYRMSRSINGPWLAPANDAFDTRAYYAAKTASDGDKRYIFGWLATRDGEKDEGGWQWGGCLVAHEITQQPDGTLDVRVPESVPAVFTEPHSLSSKPMLGKWDIGGGHIASASVGEQSMITLGEMPQECMIETEITYHPGTYSFGLLLRADENLENYYQLRFEPANSRMVFDRWPRPGDVPFMFERPLEMTPGKPIKLRVIVDGTAVVAYANNKIALSCRMYNHPTGALGLFVTEGEADFGGVSVRTQQVSNRA